MRGLRSSSSGTSQAPPEPMIVVLMGVPALARPPPAGLTGPWQVSREQAGDYVRRGDLDREYVSKRSLGTDVRILWRTLARVLG
jgi:lipopolysaccharide/colanic/teichoic acid biosynthesis glycosyltransferase